MPFSLSFSHENWYPRIQSQTADVSAHKHIFAISKYPFRLMSCSITRESEWNVKEKHYINKQKSRAFSFDVESRNKIQLGDSSVAIHLWIHFYQLTRLSTHNVNTKQKYTAKKLALSKRIKRNARVFLEVSLSLSLYFTVHRFSGHQDHILIISCKQNVRLALCLPTGFYFIGKLMRYDSG